MAKETGAHITSGTTISYPIVRVYDSEGKSVLVLQSMRFVLLVIIVVIFALAFLIGACLSRKFMYVWSFINTM